MRRAAAAVLIAVAVAAALAGCSQAAALAPVGGNVQSEVRYATIDVLLAHQVPIGTTPVCSAAPNGGVSCVGKAVAGDAIASRMAAGSTTLVVEVGGSTLYRGSMWAVLRTASEAGR